MHEFAQKNFMPLLAIMWKYGITVKYAIQEQGNTAFGFWNFVIHDTTGNYTFTLLMSILGDVIMVDGGVFHAVFNFGMCSPCYLF